MKNTIRPRLSGLARTVARARRNLAPGGDPRQPTRSARAGRARGRSRWTSKHPTFPDGPQRVPNRSGPRERAALDRPVAVERQVIKAGGTRGGRADHDREIGGTRLLVAPLVASAIWSCINNLAFNHYVQRWERAPACPRRFLTTNTTADSRRLMTPQINESAGPPRRNRRRTDRLRAFATHLGAARPDCRNARSRMGYGIMTKSIIRPISCKAGKVLDDTSVN